MNCWTPLSATGPGARRLVAVELGELNRLQHRLPVLKLVPEHHLVEDAITDALLLDHLQRAGADLLEILPGLVRAQIGKIAAVRPRGLKCVVDLGEILTQQGPSAEAVDQPQVLEGRDVPEIPDQWAHQRGMDPLQVGLGHRLHEPERALPRLAQRLDCIEPGSGQPELRSRCPSLRLCHPRFKGNETPRVQAIA